MKNTLVSTLPAFSLFGAALGSPAPASEGLSPRAGNGAVGFASIIGAILNSEFGSNPPVCGYSFGDNDRYYVGSGTDNNGNWFQVCWQSDEGLVNWDERTAEVANCLTNLHFTQKDVCISVEGSSCDNGYIASGGRLQNVREAAFGDGWQLSAEESNVLQWAWGSLVGQDVQGTDHKGPFALWTNEDGTQMLGKGVMSARFIGEDAC